MVYNLYCSRRREGCLHWEEVSMKGPKQRAFHRHTSRFHPHRTAMSYHVSRHIRGVSKLVNRDAVALKHKHRPITLPLLANIMLGLTGELGFGLCNSISPATKEAAGRVGHVDVVSFPQIRDENPLDHFHFDPFFDASDQAIHSYKDQTRRQPSVMFSDRQFTRHPPPPPQPQRSGQQCLINASQHPSPLG